MLYRIGHMVRLQCLLSAVGILALGLAASDAAAAESVTLLGSFTNQGKTYPLKGTFTRSMGGKWSTIWEFSFGKRGDHVFKGTAVGQLGTGKLQGEVVERRRFVFEGKWEKGLFRGDTAEFFKGRDKPSPTGSLELRVADSKDAQQDVPDDADKPRR